MRAHALPGLLLTSLALSACTSEVFKRGTYEAIYQKDCIERSGVQNCDPEHPSYDDYRKERDRILNPKSEP